MLMIISSFLWNSKWWQIGISYRHCLIWKFNSQLSIWPRFRPDTRECNLIVTEDSWAAFSYTRSELGPHCKIRYPDGETEQVLGTSHVLILKNANSYTNLEKPVSSCTLTGSLVWGGELLLSSCHRRGPRLGRHRKWSSSAFLSNIFTL